VDTGAERADDQRQQQPQKPAPSTLGGKLRAAGGTFLDMFSGRYLYRVAVHGIDSSAAAAAAPHLKSS